MYLLTYILTQNIIKFLKEPVLGISMLISWTNESSDTGTLCDRTCHKWGGQNKRRLFAGTSGWVASSSFYN